MILTCPDCSTRYSIKDGAIGPNGRTVRCSSCSATWFVSQKADELALLDNMKADDIETVTPAVPVQEPSKPVAVPEAVPEKPAAVVKPAAPIGAHVQYRDEVERKRRNKRLFGISLIWIFTLGLLGTAAVLAIVFRQDIVERNPSMASVYRLFNMHVTRTGLNFEAPATRHMIVDGQPVLVVNGVIHNATSKTRPVPMIELSVSNNAGEIVATWLVEPSKAEIGPRERLEYSSQFVNPPVDAVDLNYRFVDETEISGEPRKSND